MAARVAIPTWYFALTVVRLGHRFLLVHERKHHSWYLPAGRVEPGESLADAAVRETLEEAGIPIVLEGILRFEHAVRPDGSARQRVFFVARPEDDTPPKSRPDEFSLGAAWVSLDELDQLPLRGEEVRAVLEYAALGPPIYPLSLWAPESAPWVR
jgi:8-oxo-dGTP pyrophosphatase MutT (NUDIX family)